jgi:hypothetical protein
MSDRLMQAKPPNWTASREPTPRARIVNASHDLIAQSVTLTAKRFVGRLARNLTLIDYRE